VSQTHGCAKVAEPYPVAEPGPVIDDLARMPRDVPYTELAPPIDLAPYVDRFWLRTSVEADPARTTRVLPDGCVDVIVHAERGAVEVVGAMTRALELPEAPADLVAVRFRPGTAAAIVRCSLAELTDRHAGLGELGLPDGALAERVGGDAPPRERIAALVEWVRAQLVDARGPDRLVARAVALLSAPGDGDARVDRVAAELRVSRQHLARVFRREVGITPKELARIARVQRAAAALGRGADVARIAVELGYFDQSHLAHDVRELIGVTPATLAAERPIALTHLFERPVPFLQSPVRRAP
jgi:AraC-like DNA-binding protein